MICRPGDARSNEFLLFYREKSVAVDTDDGALRPYAAESFRHSSTTSSDIVAVHRTAEIIIRVGVESVRKLLALIPLVRSRPACKETVLIRFLLCRIISFVASVGNQSYASCTSESCLAALQAGAFAESRVSLQSHPHGFIECCEPRCDACAAGNIDSLSDHFRLHYGPLDGLESSDGTAYHEIYILYSEMLSYKVVRPDYISNCNLRKIKIVRSSCRWIRACRSG